MSVTSLERVRRRLGPPEGLGTYAVGNLVATCGTGITLAVGVLYFTGVAEVEATAVATAMTVGATAGLLVMPAVGRLAGTWGPRPVYVAILVLQSGALAGWQLASDTVTALAVLTGSLVAERGVNAVVGGFVADLPMEDDGRAVGRAYLRSLTNVGLAVGGGVAAVALAHGGEGALRAVVAAAACLPVVAAFFVLRSPVRATRAPRRSRAEGPARPWRDRRYRALALSNGVLAVHLDLLAVGLPLVLAANDDLPRWLSGAALATGAVAVVALQVPVTARVQRTGAARVVAPAGGALVAAVLLLGGAQQAGVAVGIALVVAWMVANTLAELTQSGVEFLVSYDAAPEMAHSEYQAAYALGRGAVRAVAPVALAWATVAGTGGWLVLALVCAGATFVHRRLVRQVVTDD